MITKLLNYETDRDILRRIYLYEENIFGDAAVGKYNIGPFTKYGACYATFDDNNIVCVIEILFSINKLAYIYGVSTNEKYRNQGYATRLLDYTLNDLRKKEINIFELTVDPNNSFGIKLYESFGFKVIKLTENEYFDKQPRYLMRKEI